MKADRMYAGWFSSKRRLRLNAMWVVFIHTIPPLFLLCLLLFTPPIWKNLAQLFADLDTEFPALTQHFLDGNLLLAKNTPAVLAIALPLLVLLMLCDGCIYYALAASGLETIRGGMWVVFVLALEFFLYLVVYTCFYLPLYVMPHYIPAS